MLEEKNHFFWFMMVRLFGIVSDHIGITLLFFSTIFGLFLALIGQNQIGKKFRIAYPVLMIIPLFSEYDLLHHLSKIHPRIQCMLATVGDVVVQSEDYRLLFEKKAGFTVRKASDISGYLYSLSKKELLSWKDTEPAMLYEKLQSAFHGTRDFFGYLDQRTSGIYFIAAFILAGILLFLMMKCRKEPGKIMEYLLFFVLLFGILFLGYNGMLLSFGIILLSKKAYTEAVFLKISHIGRRIKRKEENTA